MNYNEIFGKNVPYDNIKSYKKAGSRSFSRKKTHGKP